MSKVALSGNASGTGTLTIAAPNTNTDRTLTLPDQTATLITDSSGVLNIGSGQFYKDASGNVGIGTSSPTFGAGSGLEIERAGVATLRLENSSAGNNFELYSDTTTNGVNLRGYNSAPMVFWTNNTDRARIDSSGKLSVNQTTGGGTVNVKSQTNTFAMEFYHHSNDASVGSITTSTTATTYGTSSDYRLKNTIAPMTGALAKVAALKPCTYKWNVDGSDGEGFIAHELAEVVPQCVSGEKDAVDAEGNPQYQGIDTSFLVATLTAAIQELKAIVDAQGAEIAALKGQA